MSRKETLEQFGSCWEGLEDSRCGNAALHDFHELLMIALCCVLCGGRGAVDMAVFATAKEPLQGVVAIDGKVLRRSFDRASGKSALHMVSAWGSEQRLVLAQIATDAKSNEITSVPRLLRMLALKGTIVTADALNCQRAIAGQIVEQKGDYADRKSTR